MTSLLQFLLLILMVSHWLACGVPLVTTSDGGFLNRYADSDDDKDEGREGEGNERL